MGWDTHHAVSVAHDSGRDGGAARLQSPAVQQTNETLVIQQFKDEIEKQLAQVKQHHDDMQQLKKTSAVCTLS
jgi:hypothetical protein